MKLTIFLLAVAFHVLVIGQNYSHYAAALMIAAYVRHDGRLLARA